MSRIFSSRTLVVSLLLASGLTTACSDHETKKAEETPAVAVTAATVVSRPLNDAWETVGVVKAGTTSEISARLLGNVRRVLAQEGDRVRAGQLLLEIDPREVDSASVRAQAGLEEVGHAMAATDAARQAAHANAALAASTYKRFVGLRERKSVSAQEFDEVEARHKAAMAEARRADESYAQLQARRRQGAAELSTAQTFGSYARITAPTDGVVTARKVDVGDQAAPGMHLLTVENNSSFEVQASVEEERIGQIKPGDRALVTLPTLQRSIEAPVTYVSPGVDSASRTYLVRILLPRDTSLRSGLFARVSFAAGQRAGITVPRSAIREHGQLDAVYVLTGDGEARFRLVTLGKRHGEEVEVLSGLQPGERVATSNVSRLSDGTKVSVGGEGARS